MQDLMNKLDEKFSKDQEYCIEALSVFACGRHHLPKIYPWGSGVCINWYGDLSTYDFDRLTRLVLVAHAFAVRIEIGSSGPRMVRIIVHRRKHGDRHSLMSYEYHPALEDLEKAVEEAKKWEKIA